VCPVPMNGTMQITDKASAIINSIRGIAGLGELYLLHDDYQNYLFLERAEGYVKGLDKSTPLPSTRREVFEHFGQTD